MMKAMLAVSVAVLLSTSVATAQRGGGGACAADIKKLCGSVQPGEGRIRACIQEHLGELSEGCQARLERAKAVREACADDIKKSCAGVKKGRGRIFACLRGALANLSEPCKDALLGSASGGK